MNRMRITNKVTPLVSDARSLKAMSEVLTKGTFKPCTTMHLQNEKCGVLNAPVRRTHKLYAIQGTSARGIMHTYMDAQ